MVAGCCLSFSREEAIQEPAFLFFHGNLEERVSILPTALGLRKVWILSAIDSVERLTHGTQTWIRETRCEPCLHV